MFLQMNLQIRGEVQLLQDFLVPFKDFNGIPTQVAVCNLVLDRLLDMGQGMFHAAGKHMGQLPCLMIPGQ